MSGGFNWVGGGSDVRVAGVRSRADRSGLVERLVRVVLFWWLGFSRV